MNESDVNDSKEYQLISQLMAKYKNHRNLARPVHNSSDSILVKLELRLVQLIYLDEKRQLLQGQFWIKQSWHDEYLYWDPQDYGNVTWVVLPNRRIWEPDIVMYNVINSATLEAGDSMVHHDGSVWKAPQGLWTIPCTIDISFFPFDNQSCSMTYGSWVYPIKEMDIQFNDPSNRGVDITESFKSNPTWKIIGFESSITTQSYDCCDEEFALFTIKLHLKRRVAFFAFVLILPCCLLSVVTLVVFVLPPDSPEKINIGVSVFLSYFVLLMILVESAPSNANSVPLLGVYMSCNLFLIAIAIFGSGTVYRFERKGEKCINSGVRARPAILFLAKLLKVEINQDGENLDHPTFTKQDMIRPYGKSSCQNSDNATARRFSRSGSCTDTSNDKAPMEVRYRGEEISREQCLTYHELAMLVDRVIFVVYVIILFLTFATIAGILTVNEGRQNQLSNLGAEGRNN